MTHTFMAFIQSIIFREFGLNRLIVSLRLNLFTNSFFETFIREKKSCGSLVISKIDFKHDHCK